MEENLITKRELLETTGISYGALYRWKRMKLIPDDWFIRRSTYTGSETFFPREKILERVAKIQNMKGDMSLDDIAQTFSPAGVEVTLSPQEIAARGLVPAAVIDLYLARSGEQKTFAYDHLLGLYLFAHLLDTGMVGQDDAFAAALLCDSTEAFKAPVLKVLRKLGVTNFLLVEEGSTLVTDTQTKTILSISLPSLQGELKEALLKG